MSDEALDPFGGPLRHLRRVAPPWAANGLTVCGRPTDDVACLIEWEEAKALVAQVGQTRAQFLFCQTCLSQHDRKAATPLRWEREPAAVIADWAGRVRSWNPDTQITAELLALADLVAAHRVEYDEAVARRLVGDELLHRRQTRKRGAS